jgi:phosphatidylserine/phosphatidylglycerophosphate/cardiolipin synthase-like enzyme
MSKQMPHPTRQLEGRITGPLKKLLAVFLVGVVAVLLQACATTPAPSCEAGTLPAARCPAPGAVDDAFISELLDRRQWYSSRDLRELAIEPTETARTYETPIQNAVAKLVPPTDTAALDSLALKIWMIEQARHTVDAAYYIFKDDLAGYAVLGALCDAVIRGVDVRLIVDAGGSFSLPKSALRMLDACEEDAGYMTNAEGLPTRQRARVQVVVFNALTNFSASPNRRSHDKLLITDGRFGEQAYLITGGRNIALDYYGLTEAGEFDPKAYRDLEILLRPLVVPDEPGVGDLTSGYFSLLFLFKANRLLEALNTDNARVIYQSERARAREALAKLKSFPIMQQRFAEISDFMSEGFLPADVLLAQQMSNVVDKRVVRDAIANLQRSPNSILFVLDKILDRTDAAGNSRICSPYLFLARYEDSDGTVILDEAASIRAYIDSHPDAEIEIVTNSAMTSDNFPAQSVIDFDMAPRLLLDPELQERWLDLKWKDETTAELTSSDAWKRQVSHPRIRIYQTGLNDSDLFPGGTETYGKLHAKFWVAEPYGFVGTTNFDYRSRLYNSEMGYFFHAGPLAEDLGSVFEELKSQSYLWGSPEWLQMRKNLMELGGVKGQTLRGQRTIFKTLRATGLLWQF